MSYSSDDFNDRAGFDAFGRLRVSESTSLISVKHTNGKLPLLVNEVLGGGGSSNIVENYDSMTVSNDGDYVIRQTNQRFLYQAGKSQLIYLTADDLTPTAGVIKRFGYFNSSTSAPYDTGFDGIYFEIDENGLSCCIAKGGTVRKIPESSFNITELTGQTGRPLVDLSKSHLFIIDFQYLGVGAIRFGMNIDGRPFYFHIAKHCNERNGSFMLSPNHSIRYEVRSTGGAGGLNWVCASVHSESVSPVIPVKSFFEFKQTNLQSALNTYLLQAYRLKDSYIDVSATLNSISLLGSTNDDFVLKVLLNPTFSGALTWVDDGVNYIFEHAENPGIIVTNGYRLSGRVATKQLSKDFDLSAILRMGQSIGGTKDVIAICAQPATGGLDIKGVTNFDEFL